MKNIVLVLLFGLFSIATYGSPTTCIDNTYDEDISFFKELLLKKNNSKLVIQQPKNIVAKYFSCEFLNNNFCAVIYTQAVYHCGFNYVNEQINYYEEFKENLPFFLLSEIKNTSSN